ncbi:hypothetical protein CFBP4996_26410 (plasmid) [Agrobacterium leguminum]|uniref:hypothetical protein n=1 Tax=Agrobacterium leguminum TaxID=2792015 RepID=UPI0010C9C910|nr:hypothetical protein [Agrobacterium leguminum]WFS69528.1 hypothetical protein CFBP4996_26410 [Agrobacterium leguminum]
MAERSIYAQIDEIKDLLEQRRRDHLRSRGRDESAMAEHVLRLECVLKTLEWVRDNQDGLKSYAKIRRQEGKTQETG